MELKRYLPILMFKSSKEDLVDLKDPDLCYDINTNTVTKFDEDDKCYYHYYLVDCVFDMIEKTIRYAVIFHHYDVPDFRAGDKITYVSKSDRLINEQIVEVFQSVVSEKETRIRKWHDLTNEEKRRFKSMKEDDPHTLYMVKKYETTYKLSDDVLLTKLDKIYSRPF